MYERKQELLTLTVLYYWQGLLLKATIKGISTVALVIPGKEGYRAVLYTLYSVQSVRTVQLCVPIVRFRAGL